MWILSLEWMLLALLAFWAIGAFKRLKRLRLAAKQAFDPVEQQFVHLLELLRSSGRRPEVLGEAVASREAHARHALLPCADLLETALRQAQQQPLRTETIAALDSAWQSLQVAWHAYAQLSAMAEDADSLAWQAESQRWVQLHTLQDHALQAFNEAVQTYNDALVQFPSCIVARLSGHRAGRLFQKDAALLVQQPA